MFTIEECINQVFSYNKICENFRCAHKTAKRMVSEHFCGSLDDITKYELLVKDNIKKNISEKKTGVPMLSLRKTIVQIIKDSKIFIDVDLSKYNYYLNHIDELDASGILPKKHRMHIINFVKTQIDNYEESDDFIYWFDYWVNSGFRWAAADKICWIMRYGAKTGNMLHEKRLLESNVTLNMTDSEKIEYGKIISSGVLAYLETTTYEERKSNSWQCIEFWTSRGYSKEDAEIVLSDKIEETRKNTNWGKPANYVDNIPPEMINTKLEYWLARYDENEAVVRYKDRQSTFNFDKCIEKHGMADGITIWQERQHKWQSTMYAKSDEEKYEILLKKTTPVSMASKTSMLFFGPLLDKVNHYIDTTKHPIYIGMSGSKEYFLTNPNITSGNKNRIFFYDFCIPTLKIIVEFHGLGFHYDETIGGIPDNFYKLDEATIRGTDTMKESVALHHGYEFTVVWENKEKDYTNEVDRVISRIRSADQKYSGIA